MIPKQAACECGNAFVYETKEIKVQCLACGRDVHVEPCEDEPQNTPVDKISEAEALIRQANQLLAEAKQNA